MKKQVFQKPAMRVMQLQQRVSILNDSVRSLGTNMTGADAVKYGGAGQGSARVKDNSYNVWDDDWSN